MNSEEQLVDINTISDLIKLLNIIKGSYGDLPPFINLDHSIFVERIGKFKVIDGQLVLIGSFPGT